MLIAARAFSTLQTTRTSVKTLLKTKAPITITPKAQDKIQSLLTIEKEKNPLAKGLVIGVKTRGCNGLTYTLNYFYEKDLQSSKFDFHELGTLTYAIEPRSLWMIVGTEVDYSETPLASEFVFNNPQSKGQCGCGESFNI